MTDTTAHTFDAAELVQLGYTLTALSERIVEQPAWCDGSALGLLAEQDEIAIAHAASIVKRLARDLKFARSTSTGYLPAPVPVAEPQSLRVQS